MPTRNDTSFGDMEFYQAKKRIKERFDKIITDLQKTVEKSPHAVTTVQRFRGCLENPQHSDVSRLPFYAASPFSKKPDKINCVLCILSCAMQTYWDFCIGNRLTKNTLDVRLDCLENIATRGLKSFKLAKSYSPIGYYLLEEIK